MTAQNLAIPASEVSGVLDLLVNLGRITTELKEQAQQVFVTTGVDPLRWLRDKGHISDVDVSEARAGLYGIPMVKLGDKAISPLALGYVAKAVAERLRVVPFDYHPDTGTLDVAMANPLDLAAVEFLEKKTGVKLKVFAATDFDIGQAITTWYQQSLSTEVTAALKETGTDSTAAVRTVNVRKVNEIIREAPIAKIVTTILEYATKSRASDIHIEPLEERTRVRYRIDGILHEKLVLPKKIHDALISRIKILSDMKIDEKRLPQDGRFNFQTDADEVDLRVSSLPTAHGEKIVMRLLKKTGTVPALSELGLRGKALANLEEAIARPHGIILVTGPTGSGKTTTLYSVLAKISTVKVNVVTLEDPVEYQIAGVNQVQVNPQAGLTFASGLRAFLRQDPNIIMVGEIRDEETADLAIQAALTGHLVFSTLHTNSAAGALPRLLDMKAEPYLLASTITAIVGQRVCRTVCDVCKRKYSPAPEVVGELKAVLGKLWSFEPVSGAMFELTKGEGCAQCAGTGYKGRIGIYEVLPVTEKIGRLILERQPATVIEQQAVSEGMVTMKQDGYLKVTEGLTTMDEVLRVAQE